MKLSAFSSSVFPRVAGWYGWLICTLLYIGIFLPQGLQATHNLAGQITAARDSSGSANTYRITVTTYTDPAPAQVDRCSADLEIWTTGANPILLTTIENIPRHNGPVMGSLPGDCEVAAGDIRPRNGVVVKGTVKRNLYDTTYTFPGPGEYEIRYFDIARHGSVVNIQNAEEQSFYVSTILFITPPILGGNSTPVLLNEPLDDACIGKVWRHNPGGFDLDGDSLAYSLVPSFQYDPPGGITAPQPTTGYRFPGDPAFGNSTFTMDSITGLVEWIVPSQEGIYNFGYRVEEWRNGQLLGYVIRDMAIWVLNCDNNPPVIETISDTCVYAGDVLQFDYKTYDPDAGDSVYLELNNGSMGNNGPFSVPNAATVGGEVYDPIPGRGFFYSGLPIGTKNDDILPSDTIRGRLTWATNCDNIRSQLYQVDFFASDNKRYADPNVLTTMLTDHKIVRIRVVPPPPENLVATKGSRSITLNWDPTFCGDDVLGYRVYRKIGGGAFNQDTICCEDSPEQAGFERLTTTGSWLETSFVDSLTNVEGVLGQEICYAVTAVYDVPLLQGQPALESCATPLECVEIENEVLYLTNDSVAVTDAVNGEIFVSWSQPQIDPFFPEDYRFRLYRANNNGFPAILVADLAYGDTTYLDTGLDTETRAYNYRVEVFDALGLRINTADGTHIGNSIYLRTNSGNNRIELTWQEFVPWFNDRYEVFRSVNGQGGPFVKIADVPGTGTDTHTYLDDELNPNIEYCYFIRSFGSHGEPGVKDPLINDSQVTCDFARDDEAPCPPIISAEGDCETLQHTVTVSRLELDCAGDTDSVTINFGPTADGPFVPVAVLPYNQLGTDTTFFFSFVDNPAAFGGCYVITATDTLGNTSALENPICVDFCPGLRMPNVFSPNGDGINDVMRPLEFQDVLLREFRIFDRWGRLLYTNTNDIANLWDGRVDIGGSQAPEGVYYWYIRYEEQSLSGNITREAKGWVTLVR